MRVALAEALFARCTLLPSLSTLLTLLLLSRSWPRLQDGWSLDPDRTCSLHLVLAVVEPGCSQVVSGPG